MEDIGYLEMCVGLAEKNKDSRLNISVAAMIVNSTGEIISRGFKRISKGRGINALSNRVVDVKVIDEFRERIISLNKGYFNKNES